MISIHYNSNNIIHSYKSRSNLVLNLKVGLQYIANIFIDSIRRMQLQLFQHLNKPFIMQLHNHKITILCAIDTPDG